MLIFEDHRGLCCWPKDRIASLTPAFPDRLRVVTEDGSLGYLPLAQPPSGPWVPLGTALVQPALLHANPPHWLDPAGFAFPHQPLPSAPPPAPPDPLWAVETTPDGFLHHTDHGSQLQDHLPSHLIQVSKTLHLAPRRLRRLQALENHALQVEFDQGQQRRLPPQGAETLLQALGLSDARHLEPYRHCLFRNFLREFPQDLTRAPAAFLQSAFRLPRQLIANVIWQVLESRRQGLDPPFGKDHRGFWYKPIYATLARAGMLRFRSDKQNYELLMNQILGQMVGEDRLFRYQELGFRDKHAAQREIGAHRPDLLLLIEKDSLAETGIQAARQHGLSWILTNGNSHLIAVEYLADALHQAHCQTVTVLVFGDFDPGGWVTGHSLVDHLQRYQIACRSGPHYLVRPHLFSPEEIELFSRPLDADDDRIDQWMLESGGINGQPQGIHADWLQPPERFFQALQDLLDQLPP